MTTECRVSVHFFLRWLLCWVENTVISLFLFTWFAQIIRNYEYDLAPCQNGPFIWKSNENLSVSKSKLRQQRMCAMNGNNCITCILQINVSSSVNDSFSQNKLHSSSSINYVPTVISVRRASNLHSLQIIDYINFPHWYPCSIHLIKRFSECVSIVGNCVLSKNIGKLVSEIKTYKGNVINSMVI